MRSLRSSLLAAAVAWVALLAPAIAGAQGGPTVTLAASTTERCVTPTPGERAKPVYPAWEFEHKQGANVNVEFVFEAPDRAPKLRFLAPEPTVDFSRAVEDYAAQLRLSCMAPGDAPVTLRQGFDFVPNDGRKVAWTAMSDPSDVAREKTLDCIEHPKDDVVRIRYPGDMLRAGRMGVVVARVTFIAGTAAPEVEVLYDGDGKSFGSAIRGYAAAMRLPCQHDGSPIHTMVEFLFLLDGERPASYVLNDLSLRDFLGAAKRVPPGSVYFDTTAMKCPFDVRFKLRQPFEPNRVDVLEEDVPARRAFADWLATREFELEPRTAAHLYGQSMTIHIPCAKIDL